MTALIDGMFQWDEVWRKYKPTTRRDWIVLTVGILMAVFETLYVINPELQQLGDPFSPSIPREEWFLHLYQWGPNGCGTELCK